MSSPGVPIPSLPPCSNRPTDRLSLHSRASWHSRQVELVANPSIVFSECAFQLVGRLKLIGQKWRQSFDGRCNRVACHAPGSSLSALAPADPPCPHPAHPSCSGRTDFGSDFLRFEGHCAARGLQGDCRVLVKSVSTTAAFTLPFPNTGGFAGETGPVSPGKSPYCAASGTCLSSLCFGPGKRPFCAAPATACAARNTPCAPDACSLVLACAPLCLQAWTHAPPPL